MTPDTQKKPTTFLELVRAKTFDDTAADDKADRRFSRSDVESAQGFLEGADWQFDRDKAQAETLAALLDKAVEVLIARKCDAVRNYEGSGMYNKHDPDCRKCQALAEIESVRMTLKGDK